MIDNENPGPTIYPKIVDTSPTLPKLEPGMIADALGAEPTGEASHALGPIGRALSAARYGVLRTTKRNVTEPPTQE